MKGGLVVFLVLLFSVAHSASAANYLSFLYLGNPVTLPGGDDSNSGAISSSQSIRFGYTTYSTVYVSINGYISIGSSTTSSSLNKFSSSTTYDVIAPFAADIDTRSTGSVRYQTYSTGDSNINTVSSYIRSELGVSFYGSWMLVAEWNGVPRYSGSSFTTNTFQGVLITDGYGSTSYAVFLYYCPSMEWSGNAVIGWQAGSFYYRNHPLSGTSNSKQVACLNTATSSYNTVLFKLSLVSSCTSSSFFGCFDGTCEYSSRCDGDSDCSDGSDEVACSYDTCDSDQFQCDNGRCEPEYNQCDNYDDCGDNSDEEGCVNVGLAVGLSVGLTFLFLFIGVPICVVFVGVCVSANRSSRPVARTQVVTTTPPAAGTTVVATAQTTSAAAPATQPMEQYCPAEFKVGPQEAPPPYPTGSYPAYPPPVPQPTTGYAPPPSGYAPPPTGYPQPYPQPAQAPYGEQPYPYPHTPAYPPPTQDPPPTDAGNSTGFLLQQ